MIRLYKPYMPEELPELNNILYSGALAYGNWGKKFEQELGTYIGEEKISIVNSFNAAMTLALDVIDIDIDDEIIASPMSCLASTQPFATQGAKVIWADIDPLTGTLDPESVKKRITSKTKAIFHNHHCGYAGYIDEINEVGRNKGIYIVDDAIEAFGTEYKGNKIGSRHLGSDLTVFSFQTVRLPNTIDGGAIAFKDSELQKKANLIRDLGVDRTKFRDENGEISAKCDISLPGYGITMNEINSYIGLTQLSELPYLLSVQRANAEAWKNELNSMSEFRFLGIFPEQNPNNWVFGLLSENKQQSIAQFREIGFYASGIHLPNNYYSVFNNQEKLPGVMEFYSKFLALPSGWWYNKE